MKSRVQKLARVAAAAGLAIAFVCPRADANPPPNEPPAVEFAAVKGHECLQPVAHRAGAQLADYRAAEVRWLNNKYPGVPIPEVKTEILLSPATHSSGKPKSERFQRETFYLDGIVGAGAATCFDINLTTDPDVK